MLPPSFALAGLLALLLAAPAARACGPYSVGLFHYAQVYYEDAQGRPAGVDKDLLDALAQRSGCELRPVVESRVRIWDQLQRGSLAMTLSAIPTPQRRAFADFMPYTQVRYQLMLRRPPPRGQAPKAAVEADPALRVAVVKGFAHGPTLDAWLPKLRAQGRLLEVPDHPTVLRMLAAGRADATLAVPLNWREQVAEWPELADWVAVDLAPRDNVYGAMAMSLSAVSPADRARLRLALSGLLADGSVLAILTRHVGERHAPSLLYGGPPP